MHRCCLESDLFSSRMDKIRYTDVQQKKIYNEQGVKGPENIHILDFLISFPKAYHEKRVENK